MTNIQWLNSRDASEMLESLRGKVSDRKLRLFACACCRQFWKELRHKSIRRGIEISEQFADGHVTGAELEAAHNDGIDAYGFTDFSLRTYRRANAVDIVGDPWNIGRLLTKDSKHKVVKRSAASILRCVFAPPSLRPKRRRISAHRNWNQSVVKLAQTAYDDRQLPSGHLDATRLAVLADALEEAGCDNPDILNHCRQPGVHVRGCWVVDLILGKE